MKAAKLVHNPKAGEKGLSKKELIEAVESEGWECRYSSTKEKGWDEIHPEIDFIIVAGGDGTVRKAAGQILNRKVLDKKLPMALLPMGTANNIAGTLGITGTVPEIIKTWAGKNVKQMDVGKLEGLLDYPFFIESIGTGVFPRLIKEMGETDLSAVQSPEEEIKLAQQKLHSIIHSYDAKYCKLEIDGAFHSGKYIMLEIMNTSSIGPQLLIAPNADPGDGHFDVVLVTEEQRNELGNYVLSLINGETIAFPFETITGKSISMEWDSAQIHVDDTLVKVEKNHPIKIDMHAGALEFLVSGNKIV